MDVPDNTNRFLLFHWSKEDNEGTGQQRNQRISRGGKSKGQKISQRQGQLHSRVDLSPP